MTKLTTHPRYGTPPWLSVSFDANDGGGGGSSSSGDNPPADKADSGGSGSAQGDKDTDWKAEARKWEGRAKENSKAAEENQKLKERLDKLTPLEKLATALGADGSTAPNDVDKLTERVTSFEKTLAEERTARYRAEVANEKQLTPEQAKWLAGDTKEAMAKAADELLAAFPQQEQKSAGSSMVIRKSGTGDEAPKAGSVDKGREMFRAEREKHKPSVELLNQN
jgi:hypothetical protein